MKFLYRSKKQICRYFILLNLLFFQLLNANAQTYFCNLEDSVISHIWIGQHSIDSGLAHSGYFISVTDSVNPYGLGMEMNFPEEKRGKNTMVTVEGWVISPTSFPNANYVVTVTEYGQALFWEGIRIDTIIKTANAWYSFKGTFKIPASVTKEAVFKCFLWNIDQKDEVAIDDLKIQFEDAENPSFMPPYDQIEKHVSEEIRMDEILFSNPFYKIVLDKETHTIAFLGKEYEPIASHFLALDQFVFEGEDMEQSAVFSFKSFKIKKGIPKLKLTARSKFSTKELQISCSNVRPDLAFVVKEKYRKALMCKRSAILIQSVQPVQEVMRANRRSDVDDLQQEYWLDKQGVLFGENNNTLFIYHTPGISSLQLDTENNLLWINLDYEKDHPFLHFPLRIDTIDFKEDWSAGKFKKGGKRTNSFNLSVGTQAASPPRFMKNPSGYLATYIWTEHADFSNVQTNKATYYGSEKSLILIKQAVDLCFTIFRLQKVFFTTTLIRLPMQKSQEVNSPDLKVQSKRIQHSIVS
jgi:hypothetical protein